MRKAVKSDTMASLALKLRRDTLQPNLVILPYSNIPISLHSEGEIKTTALQLPIKVLYQTAIFTLWPPDSGCHREADEGGTAEFTTLLIERCRIEVWGV